MALALNDLSQCQQFRPIGVTGVITGYICALIATSGIIHRRESQNAAMGKADWQNHGRLHVTTTDKETVFDCRRCRDGFHAHKPVVREPHMSGYDVSFVCACGCRRVFSFGCWNCFRPWPEWENDFYGRKSLTFCSMKCVVNFYAKSLKPDGRPANWNGIRQRILSRDDYNCVICGSPATDVDHIKEVANGGSSEYDNLQSLCKFHHRLKTVSFLKNHNIGVSAVMQRTTQVRLDQL